MSSLPLESALSPPASRRGEYLRGIALVLLLAIAGLFYVKWQPYYGRAFTAAETHKIGASILTGTDAAPPAPSLQAAIDYGIAYFRAIWQAMERSSLGLKWREKRFDLSLRPSSPR